MHSKLIIVSAFVAISSVSATIISNVGGLSKRQNFCEDPGFVPCYPAGTVSLDAPNAYDDTLTYFDSLVLSIDKWLYATKKMAKRDLVTKRQQALCCNPAVQCLFLTEYNVPFCYDPTSTAYVFSDGSGGVAETGEVFDTEGDVLNIFTGDYHFANGTTGNVYAEDHVSAPSTATLTIPHPSGTHTLPGTAVGGGRVTGTAAAAASSATAASTTRVTRTSARLTMSTGAAATASAGSGALAVGILAAGFFL